MHSVPATAAEGYVDKGIQHLHRVRLSHRLARAAVDRAIRSTSQEFNEIANDAFGEDGVNFDKMHAATNELHLMAAKTEFELTLKKILAVCLRRRPGGISGATLKRLTIDKRDLVEAAVGTDATAVQALIVDSLVDKLALSGLTQLLKELTRIDLPKAAPGWAQIAVAVQVRHLVEHRDNRVDRKFLESMGLSTTQHPNGPSTPSVLTATTWQPPERFALNQKVEISGRDVEETVTAMIDALRNIRKDLVAWRP